MRELTYRNDKEALIRLKAAEDAIEKYSSEHPDDFSEEEHQEFRGLLSERAAALSEATGMKIHSLFD